MSAGARGNRKVAETASESDGNAGFLRAARDGNLQEVLEYLKGSTDINTSNPNGLNALHLASKEGHVNIVTELLRRGANVEAATKKGNTALHIASLAGHEEIVKILVENGAHVNLQAQAGFTPLYMAAQEGHAEVVRFLLASGANQSLATEDGFTPLAVALQQGHDRVVSVLLEHDTKGKVRLPALHIAAKKDDVKSAALLLQNEQNNVDMQTKSGFTPLHIAAHYGNTNVCNLLIQRGADVNFKAKNNITPLHVASRWGKTNMVQLLLDNKATIDEKTRDGLTPLHCAARSGHEAVVDLLLEREAPHSAKTKNGLTPLHMAAQGDHADCARLLLYHKANVDEVTVDYLTPLHVAAHCGNVKTAKLLLDRKCEPNARALNGFTPLHIACKKNRIKVVELLLRYGASIDATTESGLTPLHVASFMGHMNIVIYLIQHNANPDTPTVRGETSLHLAARANQTDIIRILLRNGATVDARAREQQTPLHIASRLGNVDNVVLLLQHGAAADATTKDKYTPLHIAAKEGHDEVAQVLLEHGASHDVTTKKGFTPLHIAAKYGNIKVARLLLQKDADPDVQGKNGLTPLHVATHYNHVNIAQLLLENRANPHASAKNGYTPLHIAAKKDQMDIAATLLEYGAKPNAESKNGFTPLHLAAQEGYTDIVSLLLEKNANVNAKAQNGLTPMHLAAQEDRVPVAEVLVKYGSEIDSQTKAGYTPLHTACHFGQLNMVRFLLDRGASVSATTKVGYTPLHQSAQQGHVMVVNQLLKNGASPNAVTNNGQTPLAIAQKLGYISVVDILKPVTEVQDTLPMSEDKYKVVSPEIMQEPVILDSDDDDIADDFMPQSPLFGKPLSEQHVYLPYYEAHKIQTREDSDLLGHGGSVSPLDISFDKEVLKSRDSVFGDGYSSLGRISVTQPLRSVEDSVGDYEYDDDLKYVVDETAQKKDYMEAQMVTNSFSQSYGAPPPRLDGRAPPTGDPNRFSSYSGSSFSTTFDPDNVPVDRSPVYSGFLISFMVDARGGAMRGCRHSGVRIIIPPRKCSMPTRVTCRLIKKEKLMKPPPMSEGEGLAARILEMGPVGTQFLGPIIIEVPHFASLRGKEREVVVMRSDNGESWYEHPLAATEEAVTEALGGSLEGLDSSGNLAPGGSMSSLWKLDQEEDLQAKRITRILTTDFPQYFALVSRVKQEAMVIGNEGGVLSSTVVPQVQAVLPEGTLTKPIRVGLQAQPIAPELVAKLLGNRVAVSPIVTVEPRRRKFHKPITLTIPVPKAAQKGMINQYGADRPTLRLLYSLSADPNPTSWEDITENKPITLVNDCVSFTTTVSARFWLIDCQNISEVTQMAAALYREAITVPYMAKFVVFGKRTSVEEGRLRMFCMTDDKVDKTLEKQEKFMEIARSRDIEVLEGRPQYIEMAGNLIPVTKSGDQLHVNFKAFRENRLPCTLKIRDPDQEPAARVAFMKEPKVARGEAPQTPICNLNIRLPDTISSSSSDVSSETASEIQKRHSLLREQGIVLQDTVTRSQMNLSDVADNVQGDWVILAQQLGITMSEINRIKTDYSTLSDQALAMLQLWVQKNRERATGNALEVALQKINREDVVRKCMYNVEVVDDEVEAAAARVAMDQSGFDTFKEEIGITKDSMKRGMSLDVQYDEQDMIKESESAAEESSPGSERGSFDRGPAPQAVTEGVQAVEDEEVVRTPPPSPTEKIEAEEYEEESTEEYTEIIETFQTSEDGGKTWKKYKKITRISAEGTSESVEPVEEVPQPTSFAVEAATRLASQTSVDRTDQVFDPSIPSGQTRFEETLPDGRKVSHQKTRTMMEVTTEQGDERDEVEEKDEEEVLPDGTVHHKHIVSHHRLKHIIRSVPSESGEEEIVEEDEEVPGSAKSEVLEMFEEPPHRVQETEDIEEILPDGTKVTRHVVMSRMVHKLKTHHESFDNDHGKVVEEYEIEEVVPGTESAFVAGQDSDYEEEMERRRQATVGELEEVLDDGMVVTRSLTSSETSSRVRSRSGSVEETQEHTFVTEERVSPSPRSGSPQTVAYDHGSSVDDADSDKYSYTGKPVQQATLRTTRFEETSSGRLVESTEEIVEDMLSRGILQAEEDTEAGSREADNDTPVITITEDLSTPPDEDEDVPSYFGIKYEASSEVELQEEESYQEETLQTFQEEAAEAEAPEQPSSPVTAGEGPDMHVPVIESVTQFTETRRIDTEYRSTEIEVTQKETVYRERVVQRKEFEVSGSRDVLEKEAEHLESRGEKISVTREVKDAPESPVDDIGYTREKQLYTEVAEAEQVSELFKDTDVLERGGEEEMEAEEIPASSREVKKPGAEWPGRETTELEEAVQEKPEEMQTVTEIHRLESATTVDICKYAEEPEISTETEEVLREAPEETAVELVEREELHREQLTTDAYAQKEEPEHEETKIEEKFDEAAGEAAVSETGDEAMDAVAKDSHIALEESDSQMSVSERDEIFEAERIEEVAEKSDSEVMETEEKEEATAEAYPVMAAACMEAKEEEIEWQTLESSETEVAETVVATEEEEALPQPLGQVVLEVAKDEIPIKDHAFPPETLTESVEDEETGVEVDESRAEVETISEHAEEEEEEMEIVPGAVEVCRAPGEEEKIEEKVSATVSEPGDREFEEPTTEEEIQSAVSKTSESKVCVPEEEEEIKEEKIHITISKTAESKVCIPEEEEEKEIKEEVTKITISKRSESEMCVVSEEKKEQVSKEEVQIKFVDRDEAEECIVHGEEIDEEPVESEVVERVEAKVCVVPDEEAEEEPVQTITIQTVHTEVCVEEVEEDLIEIQTVRVTKSEIPTFPDEELEEERIAEEPSVVEIEATEQYPTETEALAPSSETGYEAAGGYPEQEEDEDWEILEREELTEEEQLAAMDDSLMQKIKQQESTEKSEERTEWSFQKTEVSESRSEEYYQETTRGRDDQITGEYQFQSTLEKKSDFIKEIHVTKSVEPEKLAPTHGQEVDIKLIREEISDEDLIERQISQSSDTEAVEETTPEEAKEVDTKEEKESIEREQENVVDLFRRSESDKDEGLLNESDDLREIKETEDISSSKFSEMSLDQMSEMVSIHDETDTTYTDKIFEGIMQEARVEMEGEAMVVEVVSESPSLDKDRETLESELGRDEADQTLAEETEKKEIVEVEVKPVEGFPAGRTEIEAEHEFYYKETKQVETRQAAVSAEVTQLTSKTEIYAEEVEVVSHQIAQLPVKIVEGVAAEEELISSPGSKTSEISPLQEDRVTAITAEIVETTQAEEVCFVDRQPQAVMEERVVIGDTEEEELKPTEKYEDTLVAAMPEVPTQSPQLSLSERESDQEDFEKETATETEKEVDEAQQVQEEQDMFEDVPTDQVEQKTAVSDAQLYDYHDEKFAFGSDSFQSTDTSLQKLEERFEKSVDESEEEDIGETYERYDQEVREEEAESSPTEDQEEVPDAEEIEKEIEEQDALTAALMSHYDADAARQETQQLRLDEAAMEGGSGYESEEEEEAGLEKYDELSGMEEEEEKDEEAQFRTPDEVDESFDGQLQLQRETTDKQLTEKYEDESAEKEGAQSSEEDSRELGSHIHAETLEETQAEREQGYLADDQDTRSEEYIEEKETVTEKTADVDRSAEELIDLEASYQSADREEMFVVEERSRVESAHYTERTYQFEDRQKICVTEEKHQQEYARYTDETLKEEYREEKAEKISVEEAASKEEYAAKCFSEDFEEQVSSASAEPQGGQFLELHRPEYDLMAISGATDDMMQREQLDQELDFRDTFDAQQEDEDMFERYSSGSEEELKPLKMPVVDSPTEEVSPDHFQYSTEQDTKSQTELEESRPSPNFGRFTDERKSPAEELFLEDTQRDLRQQAEDRYESPDPEQQKDEIKEEAEERQTGLSSILAEMRVMEEDVCKMSSDDEEGREDDLEQYEEEEVVEEKIHIAREHVEQLIKEQTLVSETKITHHKEHFTGTVFESQRSETCELDREFAESEINPEDHAPETADLLHFVDRKEAFTMEERDISAPETEQPPEEESEQSEEDVSLDVFIDRSERFLEEQVPVLVIEDQENVRGGIAEMVEDFGDLEGAAETNFEQRVSEHSSVSGNGAFYDEVIDEHRLALHPPLYPSSSTEVQDRSGTPSDIEGEELAQNGVPVVVSCSYTSEAASASRSFYSESTLSHMSESEYTSRSETWAASECTMTGSDFEPEGRITVDTSEQIFIEQKLQEYHARIDKEEPQIDTLDRPMSPSEFTLITSHDEEGLMRALHIQRKPADDVLSDEDEEDEELERDSLQSEESDEDMSEEDRESERPPSPTDYTLIASQDQESLQKVLGLQGQEQPPVEHIPIDIQELEVAMTRQEEEGYKRTKEATFQDDLLAVYTETQSSESSEQALIQFLDSADNNTQSNISSDKEFGAGSEREFDTYSQLEPTAPCMPPSPTTQGTGLSSSYENLYMGIATEADISEEPLSAKDLEIGDRFDTRQIEPHLQRMGRTSSFEELYAAGLEVARTPADHGVDEEETGVASASIGAEARISDLTDHGEDKMSSSSSEVAQLEDVLDQADRSEDRSGLSEEESGDVEASESFGDEEMQTHRLLMKKEVHTKTVIGPDGQEETFIREDSHIHQDTEPPEELRDSMQQIINQFMEDPTAPMIGAEDAPKELEEGTEV